MAKMKSVFWGATTLWIVCFAAPAVACDGVELLFSKVKERAKGEVRVQFNVLNHSTRQLMLPGQMRDGAFEVLYPTAQFEALDRDGRWQNVFPLIAGFFSPGPQTINIPPQRGGLVDMTIPIGNISEDLARRGRALSLRVSVAVNKQNCLMQSPPFDLVLIGTASQDHHRAH